MLENRKKKGHCLVKSLVTVSYKPFLHSDRDATWLHDASKTKPKEGLSRPGGQKAVPWEEPGAGEEG